MPYKPWPIIILAILHLIEPLVKLPVYSLYLGIPLDRLFLFVWSKMTVTKLFLDYLLFPIMGIAILRVRPWSLGVVVIGEIIAAVKYYPIFRAFIDNQMYGNFVFFLALFMLNILVLVYFFVPAVWKTYLDAKVRWWEHKYRYRLNVPVKLLKDGQELTGEIQDISESGLFVKISEELPLDTLYQLLINSHGLELDLHGRVIHERRDDGGYSGFGIKFEKKCFKRWLNMKKLIYRLEREKAPRRPERVGFFKGLWNWLTGAVRGKDIFPDYQKR